MCIFVWLILFVTCILMAFVLSGLPGIYNKFFYAIAEAIAFSISCFYDRVNAILANITAHIGLKK